MGWALVQVGFHWVGTCTAKGIEEAELMLGNVLAPTPNEVNLKDAEEEL